ncbi:hypothetical protein AB0368_19450 [Actinoplanes sp. NPDC051475]|uniref:hypothetical protein n=1 Tax=Actinoplanes sp. NPDC051475 TaxID=3157225 RepID=UPI00344B67EB
MSRGFVVRYEMRPETADENQRLVEDVFAELADKRPEGLRYASFRLADGVTFVHVGIADDGNEALSETTAFQTFQKGFADRAASPPVAEAAELLGAYGFDS